MQDAFQQLARQSVQSPSRRLVVMCDVSCSSFLLVLQTDPFLSQLPLLALHNPAHGHLPQNWIICKVRGSRWLCV